MSISDEQQVQFPQDTATIPAADGDSGRRRRRRRRSRSPIKKIIRKVMRRFSWRIAIISVFVVVVVVSVMATASISDAVADLRNAWQSLDRVLVTITNSDGTDLTLEDLTRLQSSASGMRTRIAVTRDRLAMVEPIINLNPEWEVTAQSLEVAQELVVAAENMLSGVQPALNFMVAGEAEEVVATHISSGERVVELLELGQGRFAAATDNLRIAEALLNATDLSEVSPDLLLQVEQLRDFQEQMTAINQLLLTSPDFLTVMLGLDDERSYLVLAQNNDELRPSGGYLSTYGWFTVRSARIINYDYSPTTATSPNPPDEGFLEEQNIVIPDWWIQFGEPIYAAWDGSWYADFPSTAEMAMAYYNAGDNPQAPVDGVLSLDISGFELMLSAMQEVFVSEYGVIVTPENFRELVYDIRAFGEGEVPHKRFVAAIYRAIFEEWSELDQERATTLLGAMLEGFQQKHIMLYYADEELNTAVAALGWSGEQQPAVDNDYVLIADANLGNKSNNSVVQTLTYDVEIREDDTLDSRLTIGYQYFDDVAGQDPAVDAEFHGPLDYRSLLQVFLPAGTSIEDTDNLGNFDVIEQDNHTLFVTSSIIEYDSGERYQILYTTPPLIQTIGDLKAYRLLVQKQPGSRAQALNVQIRLPENAQVISSTPNAAANYELEQPIVDFRLELDGDRWIEVIYRD